jgi:DNA-binding protein WhiA
MVAKESITKNITSKPCCVDAEIMGFLMFAGRVSYGEEIRVNSESDEILKHFAVLVKRSCRTPLIVEKSKNSYYCTIKHKKLLDMILMYETSQKSIVDLFIENECCKSAFLRGAFLGGGILIDPEKNYNLEFVTPSKSVSQDFVAFLKDLNFDFKCVERKNNFIIYTKQSDIICDLLTLIGAYGAQMSILNVKIEKEMRNEWNRVANSENANFDKVVTASVRHIKAIEKIENTIGLESLSQELKEIAILRKNNKDSSLEELGKKMNPQLTKSGVNHRLKKILDIAENQL